MAYHLQFFRQWLRDVGVDDIEVDGSLDHARTLAQVTLETLARERSSRFRPRTVYIVDSDTREVVVAYRLTDAGPVELPGARAPVKLAAAPSRLRVVQDATAAAKS